MAQHEPLTQVLFTQQSASSSQPGWPLGIQDTHFPVELLQTVEQHCSSLVQAPSFATQQVPLLQVCPDKQQVFALVVLLVQTFAFGQHEPPIQVVSPVQASPLPQTQV